MAFWAAFAASAGMNAVGGLFQYGADKAAAKAAKAQQRYRNAMTNLSNAINQDSITVNEIMSNDAFARQGVEIQQDYQQSFGSTQVAAASAGTGGRSVTRSLFQLKQSRDIAEGIRKQNLTDSWIAFDIQRTNSAMSAAMQQDHSYIPKPNLTSYLFGAAKSTVKDMGVLS